MVLVFCIQISLGVSVPDCQLYSAGENEDFWYSYFRFNIVNIFLGDYMFILGPLLPGAPLARSYPTVDSVILPFSALLAMSLDQLKGSLVPLGLS